MMFPGRFVNDYEWTVRTSQDSEKENVHRRIVPKLDKSKPAPCDNCGEKVMALNAVNREVSISTMWNYTHDFYCDDCVESEL